MKRAVLFLSFIVMFVLFPISCAGRSADSIPEPCLHPQVCPKASYTILIDKNIPDSKRELVYQAAAAWTVRSGNTLNLTFKVADPKDMFDDSDHDGIISIFYKYPGDSYLGWAEWKAHAGKIYMLETLSDAYFLTVAKHEFGHTFHLNHYEGAEDAIMHPGVYEGQDISCLDLHHYCDIWGCKERLTCKLPEPAQTIMELSEPNGSFPEVSVCGIK